MGLSPQDLISVSKTPIDDYALMEGIRARKPGALGTLYHRYSGAVYGMCLRALTDPRDAEDLLIEIFAEIWDRGDRFDPARGSPIGHLMGLARSRLVDRLRSRKSAARVGLDKTTDMQAAFDLHGHDAGPLAAAIDAEQSRKIIHAMQTLPPDQRQALEMAYFHALSHSEIAERLGQPLGTIKSRIRQALIHLRGVFDVEN